MRKLPEIGHVGYIVENLEDSISRFREFYGIDNYVSYDFVPKEAWSRGQKLKECVFRIAQLIPDIGPKIELIQVIKGDTCPPGQFIKEHGQNIHHVAYYVDDFDAWYDYYRNLPDTEIIFEILAEDEVMGRRRSCYVEQKGTAGVIELSMKTRV